MNGSIVPLEAADDEGRYGGKAFQLGAALRNGLPVPGGFALAWDLVDRIAAGDAEAVESCVRAIQEVVASETATRDRVTARAVAVRSSAVGEDSATASFAGQHLTRLGVPVPEGLTDAIVAAWASGRTPSALAYRRKLGIPGDPRVGVVVQLMVDAECAGVMFTRDPLTNADIRVIEAAWGLGESVVSGTVDPDRYRVQRGGSVLESVIGEKHISIRARLNGDTEEVPVDPVRQSMPCLQADRLAELDRLASACERVFGGTAAHDIEWAFEPQRLYLLQRRAVTR